MNIIVTGSSGFIGSKLCQRLCDDGHNVIGIDINASGNFTQFNIDISEIDFIKFKPPVNIDIIFHLAAQSGGYKSLIDPYIDAKWNYTGTVNVVSLAKNLNVKKLIYVSSMAVYGNNLLVNESTPVNPISFYGVSKLAGELCVKLIKEHNKIDFSIFRLFATYGSGQDLNNMHQGILSIYLSQILNNNEIRITGKKDRIRELIHVNDVINALILGLEDKTNNGIFNVSNNEHITPEIIINEISSQLGKKVEIIELDGYVGDQTYITSEKSRLYSLNWQASINLKAGVDEFLKNI